MSQHHHPHHQNQHLHHYQQPQQPQPQQYRQQSNSRQVKSLPAIDIDQDEISLSKNLKNYYGDELDYEHDDEHDDEEIKSFNQKLNQLPSPFTNALSATNSSSIGRSSYMKPLSLEDHHHLHHQQQQQNRAIPSNYRQNHPSSTSSSSLFPGSTLPSLSTFPSQEHSVDIRLPSIMDNGNRQQQQQQPPPQPRNNYRISDYSTGSSTNRSLDPFYNQSPIHRSRSPSPLQSFSTLMNPFQQQQQHFENRERARSTRENERRPRSRERSYETTSYPMVNPPLHDYNSGNNRNRSPSRSRSRSNSKLRSIFNSIHNNDDNNDSNGEMKSNPSFEYQLQPPPFYHSHQNVNQNVSSNPVVHQQRQQKQRVNPQQQQVPPLPSLPKPYKSTTSSTISTNSPRQSPSLRGLSSGKKISKKQKKEILDLLSEHDDDSEMISYPIPSNLGGNSSKLLSTFQQHQQPLPPPPPQQQQYQSSYQYQQQRQQQQDIPFYDSDSEDAITEGDYYKMLKTNSKDKSLKRKVVTNELFKDLQDIDEFEEEFEKLDDGKKDTKKKKKLLDILEKELNDDSLPLYLNQSNNNNFNNNGKSSSKKKSSSSSSTSRSKGNITSIQQQQQQNVQQKSYSSISKPPASIIQQKQQIQQQIQLQQQQLPTTESSTKSSSSKRKGKSSSSSTSSSIPIGLNQDFSDEEFEEMLENEKRRKKQKKREKVESTLSKEQKEREEMIRKKSNSMGCKYGYIKALDPSFDMKWSNLIKKELPKVQKKHVTTLENGINNCRKISYMMKTEVKRRHTMKLALVTKAPKDQQLRSKKLVKEMGLYWKKYEKDEREAKKRAEKEETARRKRKEEKREAKRQKKKLNFLITQTELYSHFMSKKLGGAAAESQSTALPKNQLLNKTDSDSEDSDSDHSDSDSDSDSEDERLNQEAIKISQKAVQEQLAITKTFDQDVEKLKNEQEGGEQQMESSSTEPLEQSMDPLASTSILHEISGSELLKQPTILNAELKSYQLKGMSWIVNLYDQGINGILADEMGLGKTIQSIAVLAHLAEEKNIWGPFLIVTPKSTLHNWKNEFAKFVPQFKVLPYWGNQKQRTTLRKYWNPKKLYNRNSPFHVLVTSYNVMVLDEKYFHRIRWQYMVLDEAHAIKSSSSNRWKTLMSFNCRNRLLLTGTPIQNSMAELWALLHFIMPTLFDSHEEFAEWFSKDIENHAAVGGGLDEHQLNRLHLILKPFMLRRIKKDVENEMPPKHEIEVACSLTVRQKKLYAGLREKITLSELLDNSLSETGMKHLMNLVMQFRKVCNHPELFERSECRSPYLFQEPPEFDSLPPPYTEHIPEHLKTLRVVNHNPIVYTLPKLLYRQGQTALPSSYSFDDGRNHLLFKFSIFNPLNIDQSLKDVDNSTFSFSRFLNLSPSDLSNLNQMSLLDLYLDFESTKEQVYPILNHVYQNNDDHHLSIKTRWMLLEPTISNKLDQLNAQELVMSPSERCFANFNILQSVYRLYPKSIAPPIECLCSDRQFTLQQEQQQSFSLLEKLLLFGINNQSIYNERDEEEEDDETRRGNDFIMSFNDYQERNLHQLALISQNTINNSNYNSDGNATTSLLSNNATSKLLSTFEGRGGLCGGLFKIFGSSSIWVPSFSKSLSDSGKLQVLDKLLKTLKKEGHRVLIYCQMTKMINILEDFVIFRKYKYLRLDGSSKLEDRRDLVDDFQTDPSIFVFLLSTRACGIGINLTAADTVVFFDSDWNPTMDEQAMDRCHRLGQQRPVTVYRLVTKGTVEERVIKRAKQKHQIQSIVIAGGKFENEMRPTEVVSFLLDDDEVEEKLKNQIDPITGKRRVKASNPIEDKPFSPNDIPAIKQTPKGRPPKNASSSSSATAAAATTTNNSGSTSTTAGATNIDGSKPKEPSKKRSAKVKKESDDQTITTSTTSTPTTKKSKNKKETNGVDSPHKPPAKPRAPRKSKNAAAPSLSSTPPINPINNNNNIPSYISSNPNLSPPIVPNTTSS